MTNQSLSPLTMLLYRHTRRREFITLLGGATVLPLAARAQQAAMPVIGLLSSWAPGDSPQLVAAFRQGLKETGFVEGQNVAVEYRWAEGRYDRLPALAADLVHRQVTVITTTGPPAAQAAKAATTTIPIVFEMGSDPVNLGLITSLNRPGGNVTGATNLMVEITPKRLELLHELVPRATRVALLVNPSEAAITEATVRDVGAAARGMGLQIQVLNASNVREIDAAFATLASERLDALFVATSSFLIDRRVQLTQLAARHGVPTIYPVREHAEVGGLISYGTNLGDAWHQVGVYTGRILKGEKPANLPVVQSSKFELVINASTARMLGLTVPEKLLALADEVIE
jgi:putative tryptophan/tyrosine transport system substrate-binding protein